VCVYGGGWGGEEKARQREKGVLSCHFQQQKTSSPHCQILKDAYIGLSTKFMCICMCTRHIYMCIRNSCAFACVYDIHMCSYGVRVRLHVYLTCVQDTHMCTYGVRVRLHVYMT